MTSIDERFDALERKIDDIHDGLQRQIRGLRNWGLVAFVILLAVLIYVAWRINV